MSKVAKRAPIVGNVLNGVEIAGGFEKDGYKIGKNTTKETAGAVGGTVGAIAGAKGGGLLQGPLSVRRFLLLVLLLGHWLVELLVLLEVR